MRQLIVYPMMEVDIMLDGSAVKGPTRYEYYITRFSIAGIEIAMPVRDGMRATMRKPLHAYNNTMLELVAETEVELECVWATVMIHDVALQKLLLC